MYPVLIVDIVNRKPQTPNPKAKNQVKKNNPPLKKKERKKE